MIKSMTGFGRGEFSDGKRRISVEIKAVNHRYCDLSVRMSRKYMFAEDKLKSKIRETVSRGKVEISVIVENLEDDDMQIMLNTAMAGQYLRSMQKLKDELDISGDVSLEYISGLQDVMKLVPNVEDEEDFIAVLLQAAENAALRLDEMRTIEGQKLAADLMARGDKISQITEKIKERAPQIIKEYQTKLFERISELTENKVTVPEDKLALEVAFFADKCNITEELVRLDSHMIQLKKILSESVQPVGKKLDFLVQEMNREANTIGSKANDIETTNLMLEIKNEVEKIREQVQNIE